ncbi:hypothetical protein JXB01_00560 [Candidatus Micrarchaeota archaeon]|nr:hypothetical protein [Candidatus Micrarchaeota archaeon]
MRIKIDEATCAQVCGTLFCVNNISKREDGKIKARVHYSEGSSNKSVDIELGEVFTMDKKKVAVEGVTPPNGTTPGYVILNEL